MYLVVFAPAAAGSKIPRVSKSRAVAGDERERHTAEVGCASPRVE
jgi:hypothetical protein